MTVVTLESLNGGTTWYGAQVTGAPSLPLSIGLGGTGATLPMTRWLPWPDQVSSVSSGTARTALSPSTAPFTGLARWPADYTLTRDIMATSVTVNNGVTIRTSSSSGTYRIFCQGTVTNAGRSPPRAMPPAPLPPLAPCLPPGRWWVAGRGAGVARPGQARGRPAANVGFGVAGGAGGAGGSGGAGGAGGTSRVGDQCCRQRLQYPVPGADRGRRLRRFLAADRLRFRWGGRRRGYRLRRWWWRWWRGHRGDLRLQRVNNSGTITAAGRAGAAGAGGNAGGGGGGSGGLIIAYTLSGWTQGTTTVVTGGAGGALPGTGTAGAAAVQVTR